MNDDTIADDLLDGAEQIAVFMFGDAKHKRRVYHLAEKGELPVFRLGSGLNARRSVLRKFIEAQETNATSTASNILIHSWRAASQSQRMKFLREVEPAVSRHLSMMGADDA
jgi:hypothetical protein